MILNKKQVKGIFFGDYAWYFHLIKVGNEDLPKLFERYDQRVEAFGSGGCAMSGNDYPNNIAFYTDKAVSRDLVLNFFLERYAGHTSKR